MLPRRLTQGLLNAGLPVVKPYIVNMLPHDTAAFTQGLAFAGGKLYESTGLDDASSVRRIDPVTGQVELNRPLTGHWGEGLAVRGDRAIQLTWQSNMAIVYALDDLSPVAELPLAGEGWGLTACEDGLVMSNGSGELLFLDDQCQIQRRLSVRRKGMALRWLNDLEYARGRFFVNRLGDHHLFEIEPNSGRVLRLIDCSALARKVAPQSGENVLNGIAYDETGDVFYITGKRWPTLFKVQIPA